jgi:hypothetical protein
MTVIMVGVLHYIPDSANLHQVVTRYIDTMSSGSYLILSHAARPGPGPAADGGKMFDETTTPCDGRSREEILAFMTGTELVDPGLVWLPLWRPEPDAVIGDDTELSLIYAAVGYKP